VKRPAAPLSGALDELVAALGIPGVAALVRIRSRWEEVVGPLLAGRTNAAELRAGTLTVEVENHAWAQELQFSHPLMLERIRAILGEAVVTDIRFRSGGAKVRKAPARTAPPPRPSLPEPAEPEALSRIGDPELRDTLRSLQRKAYEFNRK
jgi:predicted nucleic acid-binding Zn ribbon protein